MLNRPLGIILLLLGVFVLWATNVWARDYGEGWTPAEKWAWDQIRVGKHAEFQKRCGALNPRQFYLPNWRDSCRTIRSIFIEQLLLDNLWKTQLPHEGVFVDEAYFGNGIDLRYTNVAARISIANSVVAGDIALGYTQFSNFVSLDRTTVTGNIDGTAIKAAGLFLDGALVSGGLNIPTARIDLLNAVGAEFGRAPKHSSDCVVANNLVARVVTLDSSHLWCGISLLEADIDGQVSLAGTEINGRVAADGLQARALIFSVPSANGTPITWIDGDVLLRSASLTAEINLDWVKVQGSFLADNVNVGSRLLIRDTFINGKLTLDGGKLSFLGLEASDFGEFSATQLQITGQINAENANFRNVPTLAFANIGAEFNLRNAKLPGLNLSGSKIIGELDLADDSRRTIWGDGAKLNLRNAQFGSISHYNHGAEDDPWPRILDLHGFTYSHVGGAPGGTPKEASLDAMWYLDSLARDRVFAYQQYQQLASVLRSDGDVNSANAVLYAARELERITAKQNCGLRAISACANAGLLWFLRASVGYGLGYGYWKIFYWIGGTVLIGVCVLLGWSPIARINGIGWCFGASLYRLLPIIKLRAEFQKCFDDPGAPLTRLQLIYFDIHSAFGFWLGSVLVAALAGLTQTR